MKLRMKWFVLLCIPALAAADTMHWVRSETHDEGRLEVSFAGTTMVVTDTGSYKEHDLYKTTWANTWTGKFKIDADTMRAELTLKDRKCSKTKSYSDAAGKTEPCDQIDKAIKIHCVYYETSLETAPGKPRDVEMLWSCTTDSKLGETPLPWVFGVKATCIEAAARRSVTTYKRC